MISQVNSLLSKIIKPKVFDDTVFIAQNINWLIYFHYSLFPIPFILKIMSSTTSILNQISISENALAQEVNGEIVILNFESESYYTLDAVGTKFWQLFTDSDNVETVIQQLVKFYTVDEVALRRDVTKFVEDLVEEGLLINCDRAIDKSDLS